MSAKSRIALLCSDFEDGRRYAVAAGLDSPALYSRRSYLGARGRTHDVMFETPAFTALPERVRERIYENVVPCLATTGGQIRRG